MSAGASTERTIEADRPRRAALFAAAGLGLALLHPPHGTALELCWVRATTGLPCPGCGLTRSVSCAVRGMLEASVAYHPLGPVIAGLLACTVIAGVLPRSVRRAVAARGAGHVRARRLAEAVLVALLLGCGAARAVRAFAG